MRQRYYMFAFKLLLIFNQWLWRFAAWVDEKVRHRYQWFCVLIEDFYVGTGNEGETPRK
jgi:hypothetical protein